MTELTTERPTPTISATSLPQHCKLCGFEDAAAPVAICERCLGPLEPTYPAGRRYPGRAEIAARATNLWRYREWLPFEGEPVVSLDTGFTPLVEAPRLADHLGVARAWIKNDAVSHPSLSFKDRVVASALNAAPEFRSRARSDAHPPATLPTRSRRRPRVPGSRRGSSFPTTWRKARSSAPRSTDRTWCACAATMTTSTGSARSSPIDLAGASSTSISAATTAKDPRRWRSRSPSNSAGGCRPR